MGGHYFTFVALETADAAFATQAAGFDAARSKRNEFSYDDSDVVTNTESDELLKEAKQFQQDVEKWIAVKNPSLV